MPLNQPLQQKKPNQTGTGYTNIQRILQANKSNQLGSAVGGGIQQAGQAARGAINTANEQFKTEAEKEKERQSSNAATANRVLGNVSSATNDDIKTFEDIRSGKSQGPTGIKNADELRGKAQEAQSLGAASGSEGGRYGLLQRFVGGNKQYTGGQQRVDNMLLGSTGANQLRSARQNNLGLVNQADTAESGAKEVGKTLQNQAQNLAKTTVDRLGQQVVDYDTAMEAARSKAQEDQSQLQKEQMNQLLSDNIYDEDLYNSMGINAGDQLWRTNLSDYYQALNNIATKQNVQTQDDYNKIAALQKLSGNSLTGAASGILPTYNDKSQVGAFNAMDKFYYDKKALADKLGSEKSEYGTAVRPHEQTIAGIDNFLNNTGFGYAGMYEGLNITSNQLANSINNMMTNREFDAANQNTTFRNTDQFKNADKLTKDFQSGKLTSRQYAEQMTPLIPGLNQILNPTMNSGARQVDHGNIANMLQVLQQQEAARKAQEDAINQKKDTYRFNRTFGGLQAKPNA